MMETDEAGHDAVRAVIAGMLVMLAGPIPRNMLFAANLRLAPSVPWAVPVTAGYLWLFWRYAGGWGPPVEHSDWRRWSLRAGGVSPRAWGWSLLAGGMGIVALVLALRVANRLVTLPVQRLPDFAGVPRSTVLALLLAAAPVAGVVEEVAFRGYMQRPIERRYGIVMAILVTGTMFAVAHLDFTLVLWPYYVTVAAIYGAVAWLSGSILPVIVLHTAGNLYSNLDLFTHGNAEWQSSSAAAMVRDTGVDAAFVTLLAITALAAAASVAAFYRLRHVGSAARPTEPSANEF